jgi:hypothetical protein
MDIAFAVGHAQGIHVNSLAALAEVVRGRGVGVLSGWPQQQALTLAWVLEQQHFDLRQLEFGRPSGAPAH